MLQSFADNWVINQFLVREMIKYLILFVLFVTLTVKRFNLIAYISGSLGSSN